MRLPTDFEPESVAPWFTETDERTPPIDPATLFAIDRPLELEVGFGKGRFLVTASETYPDINFLGIEIREKLGLFAAWRAARRESDNLQIIRGDARRLLRDFPTGCLSAIHFYFPDPWWKKRHTKRRVFVPSVFHSYARLLKPGARLNIATDVPHVFDEMITIARATPGIVELADARPLLDVTTNFEDKAARDGREVQRAVFERTDQPLPPALDREAAAEEHPQPSRLRGQRIQTMKELFASLGLNEVNEGAHDGVSAITVEGSEQVVSYSPGTGEKLGTVNLARLGTYESLVKKSQAGFEKWRKMTAPARGEVVRQMGEALREKKADLGRLVALEMGKILTEGEGEVQEMIDIADFAVGLSRQLYGQTMHSERPGHRMYEQWHPLGTIGIISAFNFPVAVWSWNAFIAAVCGDAMIWKPSLKTPLCAIATQNIIAPIAKEHGLEGVFSMIIGSDAEVGETMIADRRLPLISATGSTRMGKRVGEVVGGRLGRSLLELGGNNGIIVMDDANLDLVVRGTLFGAVGTAGQRCTTTRRLFLHEKIHDEVLEKLVKGYGSVPIGDPTDSSTLMGPLIDEDAVKMYEAAIEQAKSEGGEVLCGAERVDRPGHYVKPTIIKATKDMKIWREETFAPILYVFKIGSYEEAMAMHNDVDQGLSSAVFTNDLLTAEQFLSHQGSDCGIANVNIGTSGAEIGGAFGGEKDTGGGREAGSDSWKAYMRRQTNTINYTTELPLAQGVKFDL